MKKFIAFKFKCCLPQIGGYSISMILFVLENSLI